MRLINLTPHDIHIVREDGTVFTVPRDPDAVIPRVPLETLVVGELSVNGRAIPVRKSYQAAPVAPLPPRIAGVIYIVSRATAEAAPDRPDLVYPDDAVRDEAGRVIGCRALGTAVEDWDEAIRRLWSERGDS